MQRRPIYIVECSFNSGNISAHAEKTSNEDYDSLLYRKHLCACREDGKGSITVALEQETSLRMQRRLRQGGRGAVPARNISAHAEKTISEPEMPSESEKHLCACREDLRPMPYLSDPGETSLRMQRRLPNEAVQSALQGNISAHAEKTCITLSSLPLE